MEELVSVTIDHLNPRGWGIGPYAPPAPASAGKVEVIGGLPGDQLSVRLYRKKRGKWRADLLEVLKPSPLRVQPRCVHVPLCGGCTWQQMAYSAQLKEKEKRVKDIFAPLLKPTNPISSRSSLVMSPGTTATKWSSPFRKTAQGSAFWA